jgi:hypothetical protein
LFINSIYTGCDAGYTLSENSSLPIYLQNNDVLTISWTVTDGTDQTSPNLSVVGLTNFKEKQIPYITIIDKESNK